MNTSAFEAYQTAQREILAKLAEIANLVNNHAAEGELINFGHVGDLGHVDHQLAQLLVFLKDRPRRGVCLRRGRLRLRLFGDHHE